MVETFHYLIGLWVQTLRRHEHQNRKYVVSIGQIRNEDATEEVCVIWRNTKDLDLDKEATWVQENITTNQTFDRIYINGLNKVKNAEPIELTFREKMFEDIA
jgi:adenine-specific DNA-methyltransferase